MYMASEYDVKAWMQEDLEKERDLERPSMYVSGLSIINGVQVGLHKLM